MSRNQPAYIGVDRGLRTSIREDTMWLSFFTLAAAASLGLSIAAYLLQNATQEKYPQS